MNEARRTYWTPGRVVAVILAVSAAGKLAAMLALGDHVYPDVGIALGFGKEALGLDSTGTGCEARDLLINSRTLLGPILWFWVHDLAGLTGLRAVNFALFLALFGVQFALGRRAYPPVVVSTALFLSMFYVGTNLNVIAGEQDDMVVGVLVATAVLIHVRQDRPFFASLVMGLSFLFKFTTAVFWVGFVVYLLFRRQKRAVLLSGVGMALPFLAYNALTHGAGFASLAHSLEVQSRFSPWSEVAFKLFSTGLVPAVLISAWVASRRLGGHDLLFFCVSAAYLPYVLIMRDAYAASYVMMTSVVFSSFLIARFLVRFGQDRRRAGWGRPVFVTALAAYLVATTAITVHNLVHDTQPLSLQAPAARPAAGTTADSPERCP